MFVLTAAITLIAPADIRAAQTPAPTTDSTEIPTISIVTTIRPIELLVRDMLGEELQERFTVTTLIAPNVSPHGFEPTAAQVARLHRADIVIYNGAGLDDWAGRGLPSRTLAIRFADVSDHHDHHHHDDGKEHTCCAHGHHHGSEDEHFWLDAELVKRFAAHCRDRFGDVVRARSADADDLLARLARSLARFGEEADAVDRAFAEALKPYQNRRIVTHHNVFGRIAKRHGLGEPLVLRPLATVEPTPRDLRRAIRRIRAERIGSILIEPQFSAAAAERIRDETNVRLVAIDPLGGEASSWPDLMEAIRAAIVQSFDGP